MNWYVRKLKISIDINNLRKYFDTLETKYTHLKWIADDNMSDVNIGVGGHKFIGLTGYGIQSNLCDISKPCPPYNISNLKSEYVNTELCFGFINELQKLFPYSHQYSIASHPKETLVNFHTDNDEFYKIHIPIYTNHMAYFCFENIKFNLPADGSLYLINTSINHGTLNLGDSIRTHLFFKIPKDSIKSVIEDSYDYPPIVDVV